MVKKEEIEDLIKKLITENKKYSEDNIVFTPYCEMKMNDRGIEKEFIIKTLIFNDGLYYAEKQLAPSKE